jgi:hypothetical protein
MVWALKETFNFAQKERQATQANGRRKARFCILRLRLENE